MPYPTANREGIQAQQQRADEPTSFLLARTGGRNLQQISWEKGFGWTYNVVINIDEAISEESPTHRAHYAMRQIMEYGETQLMVQVNQTLAYKLLHYVEKFNISVEPNKNLTTDCIRGSTTFSGRFIDRMIQQVITETNELNQQEAMEVEAPTNVELDNTLVANNDA